MHLSEEVTLQPTPGGLVGINWLERIREQKSCGRKNSMLQGHEIESSQSIQETCWGAKSQRQ
jgi:hypothetical protein